MVNLIYVKALLNPILISTAGGRFPRGACANPPLGAKLLRCIGLHAYPTGVAARSDGHQRKITKINSKR